LLSQTNPQQTEAEYMSAQFASALNPFGREAYEQALGIPSGSMLDAMPYAVWSEAEQLNALASQPSEGEVSAVPSDADLDYAWQGDIYGLSASGLEVGPQDLYATRPVSERLGLGEPTALAQIGEGAYNKLQAQWDWADSAVVNAWQQLSTDPIGTLIQGTGAVLSFAGNAAYDTALYASDQIAVSSHYLSGGLIPATDALQRNVERAESFFDGVYDIEQAVDNKDYRLAGALIVGGIEGGLERLVFRGRGLHDNPNTVDKASRRAYLNEKYGRTGDLNADINIRGDLNTYYPAPSRLSGNASPKRPGGYQVQDADAHGNLSPGRNRALGHKNEASDNLVQSHHGIQHEWAKLNVAGYKKNEAPGVLLPSSSGMSHANISSAQRTRRATEGFNTDIRYEFNTSYREMIDAGVPESVTRKAMIQSYKYYNNLGAFK
jgi:hypothetical protein